MKKVLMVIAVLCISASSLHAKEFSSKPVELKGIITGEGPFVKDSQLFLNPTMAVFYVPETQLRMFFFYVGLKFYFDEDFWVCPLIGFVGNWLDVKDALNISLWAGATSKDKKFSLLFDMEFIANDVQRDYYGFYKANYSLIDYFNFGVQGEQVNNSVIFGPHIGTGYKSWFFDVEYYFGVQEINRGYNIRFVTGFAL